MSELVACASIFNYLTFSALIDSHDNMFNSLCRYSSHISPYVCLSVHLQAVCKEVQCMPAGDWTFRADNACARPGVPPGLLHLLRV